MDTKELERLIAQGKSEKCLNYLLNDIEIGEDIRSECILISAKLFDVEKHHGMGTIGFDDYTRYKAQCNHSILRFISTNRNGIIKKINPSNNNKIEIENKYYSTSKLLLNKSIRNIVISGISGSGKTIFSMELLIEAIKNHPQREYELFIMDMHSEYVMFKNYPLIKVFEVDYDSPFNRSKTFENFISILTLEQKHRIDLLKSRNLNSYKDYNHLNKENQLREIIGAQSDIVPLLNDDTIPYDLKNEENSIIEKLRFLKKY